MSASKTRTDRRTCAAIVCEHIAIGRQPIKLAERSEPEEDADSGWQFLCGDPNEDWTKAQVWSLQEVIDSDSSLSAVADLPAGTRLARAAADESWEVVPGESARQ
jgi:hypothetical protein